MSGPITLFDLASRDEPNRCWSYNVWKTRLALNYKGIPYTTSWLDHDTLKHTLKSLGIPPNTTGFEYTVPTVKFTCGNVVTDSATIAVELESRFPSLSLHFDQELEPKADEAAHITAMALFAVYLPRISRNLITTSSIPTFQRTREERSGMTLFEMESSKGGEKAWQAAEPGLAATKAILEEHKKDDGPFILGSQVCYADFIIAANFLAAKRAGDDMFDRIIGWDSSFSSHYRACEAWMHDQ